MVLQKIKLIAIAEIVIGLIALFLLLKYGPSLNEEQCGFAGAIVAFLFLIALLLIVGILTLFLHPLGRWIHIIFSPVIVFIFLGILFYLVISTPIVNQLALVLGVLFLIMLPILTIMIILFFFDSDVIKLFKVN